MAYLYWVRTVTEQWWPGEDTPRKIEGQWEPVMALTRVEEEPIEKIRLHFAEGRSGNYEADRARGFISQQTQDNYYENWRSYKDAGGVHSFDEWIALHYRPSRRSNT